MYIDMSLYIEYWTFGIVYFSFQTDGRSGNKTNRIQHFINVECQSISFILLRTFVSKWNEGVTSIIMEHSLKWHDKSWLCNTYDIKYCWDLIIVCVKEDWPSFFHSKRFYIENTDYTGCREKFYGGLCSFRHELQFKWKELSWKEHLLWYSNAFLWFWFA